MRVFVACSVCCNLSRCAISQWKLLPSSCGTPFLPFTVAFASNILLLCFVHLLCSGKTIEPINGFTEEDLVRQKCMQNDIMQNHADYTGMYSVYFVHVWCTDSTLADAEQSCFLF